MTSEDTSSLCWGTHKRMNHYLHVQSITSRQYQDKVLICATCIVTVHLLCFVLYFFFKVTRTNKRYMWRQLHTSTSTSLEWIYLSMGAGGADPELEEFTFWVLLMVCVCVESWARGTFPMRYQIPMLLSSLSNNVRSIIKQKALVNVNLLVKTCVY